MADHICQRCGAAFSRPGRRPQKFCGRACAGLAHGARSDVNARRATANATTPETEHPVDFVCDNCGTTFTTYPQRRPKPLKFCTRACCHAWQRANGGQGQRAMQSADVEMPPRRATGTHPGNVCLEGGQIRQGSQP